MKGKRDYQKEESGERAAAALPADREVEATFLANVLWYPQDLNDYASIIKPEMLHFTDEPHKGATMFGIRQEAIQTAAMCVRVVQALDSNELVFT
jgi:hypothetical protein